MTTLALDGRGRSATFTQSESNIANDLTVGTAPTLASTTLGVVYDYEGDAGTSLTGPCGVTGTSTNWISIATAGIIDADSDTQIQVEEGADDDTSVWMPPG